MPPTIRNGTSEKPRGVISVPPIVGASSGTSQPHLLLWRMPKTIRPRPVADSAAPTMSSRGGLSGRGADVIRLRTSRMATTMTTSPTNT